MATEINSNKVTHFSISIDLLLTKLFVYTLISLILPFFIFLSDNMTLVKDILISYDIPTIGFSLNEINNISTDNATKIGALLVVLVIILYLLNRTRFIGTFVLYNSDSKDSKYFSLIEFTKIFLIMTFLPLATLLYNSDRFTELSFIIISPVLLLICGLFSDRASNILLFPDMIDLIGDKKLVQSQLKYMSNFNGFCLKFLSKLDKYNNETIALIFSLMVFSVIVAYIQHFNLLSLLLIEISLLYWYILIGTVYVIRGLQFTFNIIIKDLDVSLKDKYMGARMFDIDNTEVLIIDKDSNIIIVDKCNILSYELIRSANSK